MDSFYIKSTESLAYADNIDIIGRLREFLKSCFMVIVKVAVVMGSRRIQKDMLVTQNDEFSYLDCLVIFSININKEIIQIIALRRRIMVSSISFDLNTFNALLSSRATCESDEMISFHVRKPKISYCP